MTHPTEPRRANQPQAPARWQAGAARRQSAAPVFTRLYAAIGYAGVLLGVFALASMLLGALPVLTMGAGL